MASTHDDDRSLAIRTYGHRLFHGQTLPEYLIEFAQVFLAEKHNGASGLGGSGKFPTRPVSDEELQYMVHPRIGLKRFIFFERSKQDKRLEIDERAYEKIRDLLEKEIESERDNITPADVVDIIQELLYGYNAVLLNRSWFAQSLWPISQELIFPEGMRNLRQGTSSDRSGTVEVDLKGHRDVDGAFNFHSYLYLARGGEVYYLHVLSGLLERPELRETVENGFYQLFNSRPELSRLANWVQDTWEKYMEIENKLVKKTCRWIPPAYKLRAPYTVQELAHFLRAKMDPLQKIQLLSLGVVLQILRMMHDQAATAITRANTRPAWIIHIPGCSSQDIKKLAAQSYQQCEDDLLGALYTKKNQDESGEKLRRLIAKSGENAHLLFRKLGKAAELIVPPKGPNTRFSLSEDLLKFLVMALIEPGDKLLLSEFLRRLHDHYRIIIGPDQLAEYQESNSEALVTMHDGALLRENEEAFKEMLKACGFLRDLSDATAIVENPFGG